MKWRRFCTVMLLLSATLCVQAQSADSVLRKSFETETDSLLYEISLSEGAENVYGIYDTTTYED